jgi:hypothetical protein
MENRKSIQNIYETVKAIGLVKNQYDFSKLCGRTAAWFSCVKTRNQAFTPAAALTLSLSLRMRANEILEEQQYRRAIELSELLLDGSYDSIRKKQAERLGFGL